MRMTQLWLHWMKLSMGQTKHVIALWLAVNFIPLKPRIHMRTGKSTMKQSLAMTMKQLCLLLIDSKHLTKMTTWQWRTMTMLSYTVSVICDDIYLIRSSDISGKYGDNCFPLVTWLSSGTSAFKLRFKSDQTGTASGVGLKMKCMSNEVVNSFSYQG